MVSVSEIKSVATFGRKSNGNGDSMIFDYQSVLILDFKEPGANIKNIRPLMLINGVREKIRLKKETVNVNVGFCDIL